MNQPLLTYLSEPKSTIPGALHTLVHSPYLEDLKNFTEISPQPFRAANKHSFKATRNGQMTIDIPNGLETSKLQLTEVLYSPEVGYTFVSVGNLDDNQFTVTFGGGKCVVTGLDGKTVGEVPKNHKGLYRVEHHPEMANIAVEDITYITEWGIYLPKSPRSLSKMD